MSEKISQLLRPEIQQFLRDHEHADEEKLVLNHSLILGVRTAWIAEQIAGRKKAKQKLPTWYATDSVVYPPSLNLEQCSSELTAQFKADVLAEALEKQSMMLSADLTGGFGVDSFFLARTCRRLTYIEPAESLFEIAIHNHQVLGASTIEGTCASAEEFLRSSRDSFDFIFLDPSRRKNSRKIFFLANGEPSVLLLLDEIFKRTNVLLIKASPMLDLSQGMRELGSVATAFVLSVDNECKELLFLCRKNHSTATQIRCINLFSDRAGREEFAFGFEDEKKANVSISDPLAYLYEPNASILKAGAFKLVSERYQVAKLHPHTHFYTSNELLTDFPGRIFRIEGPWVDKGKNTPRQANILSRNYPLSADQLREKLKIKDGGDCYLIACAGSNRKLMLRATRIQ